MPDTTFKVVDKFNNPPDNWYCEICQQAGSFYWQRTDIDDPTVGYYVPKSKYYIGRMGIVYEKVFCSPKCGLIHYERENLLRS